MDAWLEILKQLGFQIVPWIVIVVLVAYLLRDRLKKWLDLLLDWLGTLFQGEWSYQRFGHIFRRSIRAMHFYMRVIGIHSEKGREPTIPEAYVPLRLVPFVSEEFFEKDNQKGYLDKKSLNEPFFPPNMSTQSETQAIEEILQQQPLFVVLGDPGSGKSTLLKYLILRFTELPKQRKRKHPYARRLTLKQLHRRRLITPYPLYVPLRACRMQNETLLADILDPNTKILAGMLPSYPLQKMPKGFLERCIQRGQVVLLLDGLDEVADEGLYTDIVRKINDFYLSYPSNRIVVTCRIAGWGGGLRSDFVLYHALPLNQPQQHDFITRWYQTVYKRNVQGEEAELPEEKMVHSLQERRQLSASEEATALKQVLHERERLAELAANPMLLSLICLIYHSRRDLPRGRAALYDDCIQILLGVWDTIDKGLKITKPSTHEKRKILRHVAYILHSNGLKDVDLKDFVCLVMDDLNVSENEAKLIVHQIEVRSWLIVERVTDRFAFSHLTFQEFFVVEYINLEQHGNLDYTKIRDWNTWREPLLLMCGKSPDPTAFVETLAPHNPPLALLCLTEADSTLLNIKHLVPLVDCILDQIHQHEHLIIESIPALVSLLAAENSSFVAQIVKYFRALSQEKHTNIIRLIAQNGTKEAARWLILLHQTLQNNWFVILDGLLLIGEPAIQEVLAGEHHSELNEAEVKDFFLECYAPQATKELWERYGLYNPAHWGNEEKAEFTWAESWARRLIIPENDILMRNIPYTTQTDIEVWPYMQSQQTALAAVVMQSVKILQKVYLNKNRKHKEAVGRLSYGEKDEARIEEYIAYMLKCINSISSYDLRIQIPLINSLHFLQSYIFDIRAAKPEGATSTESIANFQNILNTQNSGLYHALGIINQRSMYQFIAMKGVNTSRNSWHVRGRNIGLVGQIGVIALAWIGVFSFITHFRSLPSAFVAVFIFLMIILLSYYYYKKIFKFEDDFSETLLEMLPVVFTWGTSFIWADDGEEIEHFMATKKIKFWYLCTLVLVPLVCGALGGLGLQRFSPLSLPLSMFIVSLCSFFCTLLHAWTSALSTNPLLAWLELHPQGHLILSEFKNKHAPFS